jgi:hypothetical protein
MTVIMTLAKVQPKEIEKYSLKLLDFYDSFGQWEGSGANNLNAFFEVI